MSRWLTYAEIREEYGRSDAWTRNKANDGAIRREYRRDPSKPARHWAEFLRSDVEREHAKSRVRHASTGLVEYDDDPAFAGQWWTYEEAAANAGRTAGWVRHHVRQGRIRKGKVAVGRGTRVAFHAGDVMRVARTSPAPEPKPKRKPKSKVATTPEVARPPVGSAVDVYPPPLSGGGTNYAPRRARVVCHYDRFALVEFPAGYRECCFYDQMRAVPTKGAMRRAG